ncbi:MAG: (2Fe-2S)-binding protein [Methylotetracoccus sp.]
MCETDSIQDSGPDPDEVICRCSGTRVRQILRLIERGITEIDEVSNATGACSGCGGCDYEVQALLAAGSGRSALPVG